jgi:uncharacterized membrane protein YoaT (DUF817 family)
MISRILSAIIAVGYLLVAYFAGGGEVAFKFGIFLVLPLACIWFSDAMGSFTGVMRGQAVTTKTPGRLVAFGGWLLLILPVIIAVIQFVSAKEK